MRDNKSQKEGHILKQAKWSPPTHWAKTLLKGLGPKGRASIFYKWKSKQKRAYFSVHTILNMPQVDLSAKSQPH